MLASEPDLEMEVSKGADGAAPPNETSQALALPDQCQVCKKNLTQAEVDKCKSDHVILTCDEDTPGWVLD